MLTGTSISHYLVLTSQTCIHFTYHVRRKIVKFNLRHHRDTDKQMWLFSNEVVLTGECNKNKNKNHCNPQWTKGGDQN
jgi:hypothetical protein